MRYTTLESWSVIYETLDGLRSERHESLPEEPPWELWRPLKRPPARGVATPTPPTPEPRSRYARLYQRRSMDVRLRRVVYVEVEAEDSHSGRFRI